MTIPMCVCYAWLTKLLVMTLQVLLQLGNA
jgi:hypothetical protein